MPIVSSMSHRLEFELPEAPIHVDGDPVRLAQVFQPDPQRGEIFAGEEPHHAQGAETGAEVDVGVVDQGVGIAPQDIPRLFQVFGQLDSGLDPREERPRDRLVARTCAGGTARRNDRGPKRRTRSRQRVPRSPATWRRAGCFARDPGISLIPFGSSAARGPRGRRQGGCRRQPGLVAATGRPRRARRVYRRQRVGRGAARAAGRRVSRSRHARTDGLRGVSCAQGGAVGRPAQADRADGLGLAEHRARSREAGFDHHSSSRSNRNTWWHCCERPGAHERRLDPRSDPAIGVRDSKEIAESHRFAHRFDMRGAAA